MDDRWPGGKRFAAFFSFDVDGESWLLATDVRNADLPVTMSQAAYGPKIGVYRILGLLAEMEIVSTFFVPSWVAQRYPAAVEAIVAGGHELALHGHIHERPDLLSEQAEIEVVEKSIEILTAMSGRAPIGHRAPGAEISLTTNRLLAERDVEYTSHHMDSLVPYFHDVESLSLLELPMHWVCDDWGYAMVSPNLYPAAHVNPIMTNDHVVSLWSSEMEAVAASGGLFTLVNHPQVTGRPFRTDTLRQILAKAIAMDAWIANGEQINDHWRRAATNQ
jgi:peptidoglycan/xylan/chitin deacetylase (PgdA/CDA1 family)